MSLHTINSCYSRYDHYVPQAQEVPVKTVLVEFVDSLKKGKIVTTHLLVLSSRSLLLNSIKIPIRITQRTFLSLKDSSTKKKAIFAQRLKNSITLHLNND